ncbi:OprD family porin [Pseudomonas matsuisoli]|uniref:Porin D n=1 Tax=Pseudomonas matsuisoli TaxID=1515666 RepID=A0A917Q483_9PSED|nr:OprD family porin [Pseudomonas matsuisoli]GGK08477.1 porin D [Pseudomonas matsuisoli]
MQTIRKGVIAVAVAAASLQMAHASQQSEAKGFAEGSKLNVLNRNMFMQRDWKNGDSNSAGKSYVEEWGHSFITTFNSGFTQGTVGFGLDAYAGVALKLDSSQGRSGAGMLEVKDNGDPKDEFSIAGAAVKAQFSSTVIKYGNQLPNLPIFAISDSRLLPETVIGTLVTSNEIKDLTLNAGRFTALRNRNQSMQDSMRLTKTDFFGGTYKFTEKLSGSAYWAETEDYFRKYYGNINYVAPLSDTQSLIFDVNMYDTKSDGEGRFRAWDEDELDNRLYSFAVGYKFGAHTLTLSHQRVSGDGGYVYDIDGGSTMFTPHSVLISDFNREDEKSWGVRYDLNMAGYGVPGLTFMGRYIRGTDFTNDNTDDGEEWERDIEAKYVLQNGPAKDLSMRLRYGTRRSSDIDNGNLEDLRVIVEYPLSIL